MIKEQAEMTIGLTTAEVEARTARGETNAFKLRVGRTYWQIIRYNILNIFNITLFILLVIVLLSRDYMTVIFAGTGVVGNSLIGTIQEINAKRKLDKMAGLAAAHVDVIRDDQRCTIGSHEVVIDEVIVIKPGDRLVVDGVVLQSDGLEIDESHLTGESDLIDKAVGDEVSSGSFCVAGMGLMKAQRIGQESTVNRLSSIAKVYKHNLTPTQHKIAAIVQFTLMILAVFGPMILIAGYVNDTAFFDIIRNAIVFVTTLVPQGLILVVILSLTIGAVKISRHQTLIQQVNAVESLANVTVLCFDKTGTITHNQLAVDEIRPLNGNTTSVIITDLQTYTSNMAYQNSTAAAIARYVSTSNGYPKKLHEVPFNAMRRWGAVVLPERTLFLGVPEVLLVDHPDLLAEVSEAAAGLRVLAFAAVDSSLTQDALTSPSALTAVTLQPLAFITISDQIRGDIQATLNAFREQNVHLKVISGDNLQTVCAVADKAGLPTDKAYTGDELKALSEEQLQAAVIEADVFARIEPETKRKIVVALQQRGHYVAMVGDGVNDVPALKAANLAIVMNDGAQISKDIADIVLLNNALSTLPLAFHEGRQITQTIFGTTKMFLTKNFYNINLFIFIMFMSLPFPITPVQISWISFATVNLPAGLMAMGLLRPHPIKDFRHDVLDYIFTAGAIGASGMALLYVVTWYYTGDLEISQSTTTLFFAFYGWMIVINTQGMDLIHPSTLLNQWQKLIIATLITGSVMEIALIIPAVMNFTPPPLEIVGLAVVIQLLCAVLVSWGMRYRGLLHGFYRLVERPD